MELLREKYKTYKNASKRRDFENGVAVSKFKRGTMRHVYRYSIIQLNDCWRVRRQIDANAEGNVNPEDIGPWQS